MKNVRRIGRTMIRVGFPMLVLFTLINIFLFTSFHQARFETTSILKERFYNKNSDSSSKKLSEIRDKLSQDDNLIKVRQFGNAKKEWNENDVQLPPGKAYAKSVKVEMKDESVDRMVEKLKIVNDYLFFPKYFWNISLHDLTRRLGVAARQNAKGLPGYTRTQRTSGEMQAWKLFHRNIRQFSLYDPDDANMYIMLNEIATLPIIEADENTGGSQLKLNVRFSNEGRALLKFMRYPRHVEANENSYIFDDFERHVAEIAAFQLDKILGFYRVPPTIGRRVNISSELEPIMPESITDTLFKSPADEYQLYLSFKRADTVSKSDVLHLSADIIMRMHSNMLKLNTDKTQVNAVHINAKSRGRIAGNLCFYGECLYYCDSAHAFCGHPDMIEASVQSYFPSSNFAGRRSWYQPWRPSYNKHRKAYWEENDDLCDSIRNESPYNNGKLLLDMIDAHTFDFLTGNKDRHGFTTFKDFGNYTFPIMYDNGRGFGRQTYDTMSILAPLRQCCLIRKSTLLKYVKLYVGPERLSVLMEKALEADPIAPVLIKPHLNALDRRLIKILKAVAECIEKHPINKVVISDRF